MCCKIENMKVSVTFADRKNKITVTHCCSEQLFVLHTAGQSDQLNRMKMSTVKTKQDRVNICKNSKILK